MSGNRKLKVKPSEDTQPPEPGHSRHMIGYARVSMSDQDNRRQIDDLTNFGVDVRDIYTDIASGKTMKRPGWQACWQDLSEGDLLVVHAIDRLGRNLVEVVSTVHAIHSKGCDIKVLSMDLDTRTPTGRLIFAIVAAMAEWERELIVERTRHGLKAARARGKVGGADKRISDEQVREAMARIIAGEMVGRVATSLSISRQGLDKRIKKIRELDLASQREAVSEQRTRDLTDGEITDMAATSRTMRRLDEQASARRRRPSPPASGAAVPAEPTPRKPQGSSHG